MFGRQLTDHAVIEADARHGCLGQGAGDIDDRRMQLLDAGSLAGRVEGGDDAVAVPVA